MSPAVSLSDQLSSIARRVEEDLDRLLPPESEPPAGLHRAMRYAVFAGGKRLRPALCVAAARCVAGPAPEAAWRCAGALECLHTYTLVHDDLPAMDDDVLRRGRPTVHVAFDEATAILAGDALLTLAFEILAATPAPPPYPAGTLALELAAAAGSRGVVGGQSADMDGDGRTATAESVEWIHARKTGALIRAACRMGAIAAGAGAGVLASLTRYGECAGLAFQIADDVLDATSTPEQMGKSTGRDAKRQKAGAVAVWGIDGARQRAAGLAGEACAAIQDLGAGGALLRDLAEFAVSRAS